MQQIPTASDAFEIAAATFTGCARRDSKGFLQATLDSPCGRQPLDSSSRPVTRYQTDLTDAEWRVIAPHLPKPCATGWPRAWPMREIVNGIIYVMRAGCP
jgi:hypothetical protein